MQFRTCAQSVIISFSSSSQNFLIAIVPSSLSELGRNLATCRRTDLLRPCPMEDDLSITMLAPMVNQSPEYVVVVKFNTEQPR